MPATLAQQIQKWQRGGNGGPTERLLSPGGAREMCAQLTVSFIARNQLGRADEIQECERRRIALHLVSSLQFQRRHGASRKSNPIRRCIDTFGGNVSIGIFSIPWFN